MADIPGGVIGSAPVAYQPIGASTPTVAVATAIASAQASSVGASLFSAVGSSTSTVTSQVIGASLFDATASSAGATTVAATSSATKKATFTVTTGTTVNGVAATLADAGAMSSASTNIAAAVGASLAAGTGLSQLSEEFQGGKGGTLGDAPIAFVPIGAQTQRGAPVVAVSQATKASAGEAAGTTVVLPVLWGSIFTRFTANGVATTLGVGDRGFIWDYDSVDPETIYVRAEPRNMAVSSEHRQMAVVMETRSLLARNTGKLRQNPRYRRAA